ncbi:SDR family NAD(P)-dependent oxidoreductase [Nonomuraea dietziae]|uniref:SDR family NAD(P)-dependent oxidoreductase n=1 Tax=Nonomuraea dietziae TaxID=65515 RepID=UPI0031E3AC7B
MHAHIPDQSGRIAVVTGANSGIGYVTARELARRGAHVVLACRSPERGRDALDRLLVEAPGSRAELRRLDLSSLESVRSFAAGWDLGRLDLLINNAGVAMVPFSRTADGFETHFGVNHLGTFALTGLLMPYLLAGGEARVVTVSSEGQRFARFDLSDLNAERGYSAPFAYVQSKRANLYFAVELQRRMTAAGLPLRSMAVAPGLTRTNVLTGGANAGRGAVVPAPHPAAGPPDLPAHRGRRAHLAARGHRPGPAGRQLRRPRRPPGAEGSAHDPSGAQGDPRHRHRAPPVGAVGAAHRRPLRDADRHGGVTAPKSARP